MLYKEDLNDVVGVQGFASLVGRQRPGDDKALDTFFVS
jgi:hypothetical protein